MIEVLRIADLAIVERAEVEFGRGLNVLTGETGAGKSIVLGALGLLAGGRAAARSVREGSEEAVVEALFRTQGLADLESELERRGLAGDRHELVVRRSVARSGRSRAQLSGQLVPLATLAELFSGRVEISSQHDSHALLRPEVQGRLLDRKGGLLERRHAVETGVQAVRGLDAERARLRERERERAQRLDFLTFQVREIDEAKLDPGEIEQMRTLRARLAHAERLRVEGGTALARLAGDADGLEASAAGDALADAARALTELGRFDPVLGALAERLVVVATEVRDAAADLERHLDGIEADPARLDSIDERLHRVEQLQRKYGPSVEDVLRHREQAAAELAQLEGADERAAALEVQRRALVERLQADADALSEGRARAAKRLAREVEFALRELAMPHARFAVVLSPLPDAGGLPCGPSGAETAEFAFCANRGEALRSLRHVASGGELSRAFLAIKQVLREEDAGMVLVFDEVDAGVGGAAADRLGRRLAELAARHQVLCITHLPQIAAFADAHFRVLKRERAGRTVACIEQVEGRERIAEIARMAGGERAGKATLQYARELLAARAPR
ncbi:MAG: DNA repair protein RecN [Myxococcales bacterium]|nr:DNA repair protein RecN [Myxococcales bacterium]MDH5307894.1 DNA repair protein RecN [Myxococcales bacterium]